MPKKKTTSKIKRKSTNKIKLKFDNIIYEKKRREVEIRVTILRIVAKFAKFVLCRGTRL